MQERFEGKNVIVTGAGTGIGKAIAHRFLSEGAEVLLLGRRQQVLEDAVREIDQASQRAWWMTIDVTKPEACKTAVERAIERWGKIDVLVNNAGIDDGNMRFLETDLELWDRVINTNLRGPFVLSQLVARTMAKQDGGVILHNASIDSIGAEAGFVAYNCSKAALVSLAKTMAVELAPHGIRVNCVSPGYTRTELTEKTTGPEMLKYLETEFERVPMRRLARPEEIAAAFAFLASDDARFITGQNIIVDGGLTANLYILETLSRKS